MRTVISPFVFAVADPTNLDKKLIWSSDHMGRSLVRVDSERWARFANGHESVTAWKHFTVEGSANLMSVAHRERLIRDLSKTFTQIIMPSAACPLGCNLIQFGNYCGQTHNSDRVPRETIERLKLELQKALKLDFRNYSIGFFGAEPLTQWRLIEELMSSAVAAAGNMKKRHLLSGKVVTSGLLLTNRIFSALVAAGVEEFEITIDGRERIHDERRPTKQGAGTFHKIVQNAKSIILSNQECVLKIRINVDSRNESDVLPLLGHLLEEGILPKAQVYVAPIRDWGDSRAGSTFSQAKSFAVLEMKVFDWLFRNGIRPELLPKPKLRTCLALSRNPSVTAPNGEKYFCTETPLTSSRSLDARKWKDVNPDNWRAELQAGNFQCKQCGLLPACGGSCPNDWLKGLVPCPPIKQNVLQRIQMLSVFEPECVVDM